MFKLLRYSAVLIFFQFMGLSVNSFAQEIQNEQVNASAPTCSESFCAPSSTCCASGSSCRNILFELKTAAFFPTHRHVRDIYGVAAPLFGAEVTFQICPDNCWYGFASIDLVHKRGRSVGLCDHTTMNLTPITFGFKYFVPFGADCSVCSSDFYVGFGLQAAHLRTKNRTLIGCTPLVRKTSNWGGCAIAKLGTYINLPHNLFLDFFIDYQITRIRCGTHIPCVIPIKAKLDGVALGIGFGYRFN